MCTENLLVALDVDSGERALALAAELRGLAGGFKIGTRLFTLEGPALVRRLVDSGARVFLDLKFHDIPNTVAQAVESAVQTGAWMINVHASGGIPMMQAAAAAGRDTAARFGRPAPLLIAVTVLTSMDEPTLQALGVQRGMMDQVVTLARMTQEAGLDGVVASPHEILPVREAVGRAGFLVVTPGIHPSDSAYADQKRVTSPAEAVRRGADFIVVGRAILNAPDPARAARAVVEEMDGGGRQ